MRAEIDTPAREYLLDVSRLIWRLWNQRLPTGIDRVCIEYVERLGSRSRAVIQFKGSLFVLSADASERLFQLLRSPAQAYRVQLLWVLLTGLATARKTPPWNGMIYLNVGHTGLHESALPAWIAKYGLRAIYLIHDLIPITHPHFCRAGEAVKHVRRMKNALASATGIIGNSQVTIDDLTAFAATCRQPMPPHLVAWISGKQPSERPAVEAADDPYFVTLGTIEARKNHVLLLRIWGELVRRMGERAPKLVIVGQRGWKAEEALNWLDQLGDLAGHIIEKGTCNDEELGALLSGARALLMPSFVEGFGLPVVEALELGTPVIASDLPIYHETIGGTATYLNPCDDPAWLNAVEAFIAGPERERAVEKLKNYVAPSWNEHFSKVESWLANLPTRDLRLE